MCFTFSYGQLTSETPEVDALMHTDPLKIEIAITIYYQSKLSEFFWKIEKPNEFSITVFLLLFYF